MKINILIVDDSEATLVYVESLLESIYCDYNIMVADSGKKALQTIQKNIVDLIVLDTEMPDMSGFEVAKALKSDKHTAAIPIVFLTASTKLRTKGLEIGAVDYLTKPIDPDQFTSRILLYTRLVKSIKDNRRKDQVIQEQSRLAQMGEMISMIAHQWRQPLGAIASTSIDMQMQSELEKYDLDNKEEAKEYESYINKSLATINKLVKNLTHTIDDFRNFYKPNKQSVTIKLEDVVTKSLNIIGMSLTNNNIEIVREFNSKDEIELYASEMMQVILNIITNAQDNFKEKAQNKNALDPIKIPTIKIKTEGRTISICDNGGGIPESILENIFDPYFSTKGKNGTGLGLYMSKTIIEDHHHGKLNVINTDDGACFIIELGKI